MILVTCRINFVPLQIGLMAIETPRLDRSMEAQTGQNLIYPPVGITTYTPGNGRRELVLVLSRFIIYLNPLRLKWLSTARVHPRDQQVYPQVLTITFYQHPMNTKR